jgi:hypothetical protein
VTNHEHINELGPIVDRVDYAIVADPDSPQIFGTAQFLRPDGPWLFFQSFQRIKNSSRDCSRKTFELFAG